MRSVAPRIVNDVSCVTDINHESHFARAAVCQNALQEDAGD